MELDNEAINKLVVGARHGLIGTIVGKFLGVLGSVIAARILGPTAFGLYAVGWTLLRFLSLLFPLGMDRALLRFAPNYWKKDAEGLKGLLFQTISLSLGAGFIFGLAIYIFAPWLASTVYQKSELQSIFRLFSFVFPTMSLLIVAAAATRITQHVKISILVQDLGQPVLSLILMVSFYLMGVILKGVIFAEIISISLSAFVALVMIRYVFPEIIPIKNKIKNTTKELLTYSIPAALGGAFSVYIFWIDRILVGYFLPFFENGVYLAVSQISTIFLVISAGINMVVVPIFSDLYNKRDMKSLEEIYRISTKWGIYFSSPILIVLLISSGEMLSLIYGDSYRSGAIALLVLLIGQGVNIITGSVSPLLIMTGNQKFLFTLSGITLALDLVLSLFLIPKYGLPGAAISTSISLIVIYCVAIVWVKIKLHLWPYDKRYIKGIIATLAGIIVVLIIKHLFSGIGDLIVIFQGIGGVIIFILCLYLQKFDLEDQKFIDLIKRNTFAS